MDLVSISDAIHQKVCLCASRRPTHGPAFACRDSCRVAGFCIRSFVLHCFPHAPSSMLQHVGCARMTHEIAHAAIRLRGWPQRPPPRALSLGLVRVGRCSALVRGFLWATSKRAREKRQTRANTRAARTIAMLPAPSWGCACFCLDSLLWT